MRTLVGRCQGGDLIWEHSTPVPLSKHELRAGHKLEDGTLGIGVPGAPCPIPGVYDSLPLGVPHGFVPGGISPQQTGRLDLNKYEPRITGGLVL